MTTNEVTAIADVYKPVQNESNISFEGKILKLNFLYTEGGVQKLFEYLSDPADDSVLKTEVFSIIVQEVWIVTKPNIMKYIFFPYVAYFLLFIGYITFGISVLTEITAIGYVILPICVAFSSFQIIFEAKQISEDFVGYFTSAGAIWNLFDILSSILVITFSIMQFIGF